MFSKIFYKSFSSKTNNEDYCQIIENENFKAIIIADGIGSHFQPNKGSKFCVETLKNKLQQSDYKAINPELLNDSFQYVYHSLKENPEFSNYEDDKKQAFGTTLLVGIELEEKYVFAYVGNGSIWYIRNGFQNFSPNFYFPWSAVQLLNPHTVEKDGKEALYKYFALELFDENQIIPSILEISKDKQRGEIIILSTDGLYSIDQIKVGKDKNQNVWIEADKKMIMLMDRLKFIAKVDNINEKTNKLDKFFEDYCTELKEQKLIDDDITFGIFLNLLPSN